MKLYVFGKFEFRSILFEWKIRQLRPAFSLLSFRYLFISNFFSCERERENRWKFRSRSATNAFPFLHDVSDDNERRWLRTNLSIFRIQFWSKFDFRFYRRRQSAGPCRARFSLSFACIAKFVYCSVPWTSAPRRSRALRSIFLCKFMVILFDAFIEFIFGWVFHELKQQSYRNLRWHRVQMPHDLDRHSPADKEDKKNKTRHHKIYREGIKHENFVCVASLFQELHNFVSFAAADGAARSVWHLLFRFRHKWKCGTHVPGASAATIPICQLKQAIIHFVIFHYIQPVSHSASQWNEMHATCLPHFGYIVCAPHLSSSQSSHKFARIHTSSRNPSTAHTNKLNVEKSRRRRRFQFIRRCWLRAPR